MRCEMSSFNGAYSAVGHYHQTLLHNTIVVGVGVIAVVPGTKMSLMRLMTWLKTGMSRPATPGLPDHKQCITERETGITQAANYSAVDDQSVSTSRKVQD